MGVPLSLFAMQWDYQKLLRRLAKEAEQQPPLNTGKSIYSLDPDKED